MSDQLNGFLSLMAQVFKSLGTRNADNAGQEEHNDH